MRIKLLAALAAAMAVACGSSSSSPSAPAASNGDSDPMPTFRTDVTPVTRVQQAQPDVFIPPFQNCVAALSGDAGAGPDGKVCTYVAVSGCTEAGRYFPDYASCAVVQTQRPYSATPLAGASSPSDPRLQDAAFMTELAWVTSQVRAAACTCCHDPSQAPGGAAAAWDITATPIWTDTASNGAIALFSGLSDSTVFGHYEPSENNGFERTTTGIPSTDATRMQTFWFNELARRGITQAQAAATPPFGAPLLASIDAKPGTCGTGVGIDSDGVMTWGAAHVRYVYVLETSASNPGLPPDADLPAGTLWRLDVLASGSGLGTATLHYGTTPAGTFQAFPVSSRAPALQAGTTYHLYALEDVGYVVQNCLFTYGG